MLVATQLEISLNRRIIFTTFGALRIVRSECGHEFSVRVCARVRACVRVW
jgi:hypothetical protein